MLAPEICGCVQGGRRAVQPLVLSLHHTASEYVQGHRSPDTTWRTSNCIVAVCLCACVLCESTTTNTSTCISSLITHPALPTRTPTYTFTDTSCLPLSSTHATCIIGARLPTNRGLGNGKLEGDPRRSPTRISGKTQTSSNAPEPAPSHSEARQVIKPQTSAKQTTIPCEAGDACPSHPSHHCPRAQHTVVGALILILHGPVLQQQPRHLLRPPVRPLHAYKCKCLVCYARSGRAEAACTRRSRLAASQREAEHTLKFGWGGHGKLFEGKTWTAMAHCTWLPEIATVRSFRPVPVRP